LTEPPVTGTDPVARCATPRQNKPRQSNERDREMPKSDFIETEGTIIRMRGHGFYTVALANGHEVLARMSGRMSKNHIRVIQDDRVLLEISPADWSQGRIVYRYK
jgi:translation initiation factor IF-1